MKKLIALLLALVMVFSLMACTAKEEPEKEDEKPADSEQKPAEDKKEEEPKEEEKEEEQEEEPVEESYLPLVKEGEDNVITIGLMQNTLTEDYETNEYTLWLEEQTGVDLEFVYFSADGTESVTQLNLMLAGGNELPDILWNMTGLSTTQIFEYGRDGYVLDLTEYFPEYGYWFNQYYAEMDAVTQGEVLGMGTDPVSGGIYGYPHYEGPSGPAVMAHMNQKWLDAVGAEMPTTVDELYEVLKLFATEDPNGNGIADELPAVCRPAGYRGDLIMFIINAFIYCMDEYIFNVENGEVYVPYTEDEYREALIYLNKLYAEGLLSSLTYTLATDAEVTAIFTPADGVALSGLIGTHAIICAEQDNEVLYEYVPFRALEDATGRGGYENLRGSTYSYRNLITADCENPVLAFKLLDFMASPQSWERQRYGIPGTHFRYAEEGEVAADGKQAGIMVLDPAAYTEQNNVSWHATTYIWQDLPDYLHASVADAKNIETWTDWRQVHNDTFIIQSKEGKHPAEAIFNLVYTDDENETMGELKKPMMDYVKEARALFITGTMDPNSDADWESYLSNLELQGVNTLIEIAQAAYDRMQ